MLVALRAISCFPLLDSLFRQGKCHRGTSGRPLATWAKIAASPGHNRSPDRCSAPVARLPFSSIHPMAPLIFSRLAFGVKKIGDRRPAHRDCFFQNSPERVVQCFGLLSRQTPSQARRMNLRSPQTFIRVNIPNAPQYALIQQQRLDPCPPHSHSLHKFLRAHFQRVGPEPV